ncbi:hypothetical protein D9613_000109 [Agrocybe pediades]|uniref:Uncharacterized protein n=1 Tax=Agrocybe pediades TaxID=84607 RepID=A0A8H4R239_9AGAR|nr:hypothetical protein D9613_000109 [Agrocybe pediades]
MAPIRTGDIAVPSNHRRLNPSTVARRPQDDKRKKNALPGPVNGQPKGSLRTSKMPSIRMDGLVGLPPEVIETLRYYQNNPLSWMDEEPTWIGKNTIRYCSRCSPLGTALKVIDMEKCSPEDLETNKTYLNGKFCELCKEERGLTASLMPPRASATTTTMTFGCSSVYSPPTGEVDTPQKQISAHSGNYFDPPYAGPSAGMPACYDGMSGVPVVQQRPWLPDGYGPSSSTMSSDSPQNRCAQIDYGQASTISACSVSAPYWENPTPVLHPSVQEAHFFALATNFALEENREEGLCTDTAGINMSNAVTRYDVKCLSNTYHLWMFSNVYRSKIWLEL